MCPLARLMFADRFYSYNFLKNYSRQLQKAHSIIILHTYGWTHSRMTYGNGICCPLCTDPVSCLFCKNKIGLNIVWASASLFFKLSWSVSAKDLSLAAGAGLAVVVGQEQQCTLLIQTQLQLLSHIVTFPLCSFPTSLTRLPRSVQVHWQIGIAMGLGGSCPTEVWTNNSLQSLTDCRTAL